MPDKLELNIVNHSTKISPAETLVFQYSYSKALV
ncbi:hypothetical protein L21SP3_01411 [Sedimentisphaera cyanobacteriorum]|uniref:Uncharacterized protein n=1 Tax=Sedimentisphaera cyanobacteriorum TaxID=1940790 RepID=A0A1Q2HQT7_9BACT|nr:hypothetical protein L21SP3_01411 [Sedimentisphaera cyanobacteriorum]